MIPEARRNSAWDLNDSTVTDTWEEVDLSDRVPNGTKAILGLLIITGSADQKILLLRSGESGETDNLKTRSLRIEAANDSGGITSLQVVVTIMAPNGVFDYRRLSSSWPIDDLKFHLRGYYI
jgi:hypothetical protein